jgi:hypothetical protein
LQRRESCNIESPLTHGYDVDFGAGSHGGWRQNFIGFLRKYSRDREWEEAYSGPMGNFGSGRLARIFNSNSSLRLSTNEKIVDSCRLDHDVGSQLPDGGPPHYKNGGYQGNELEERNNARNNCDSIA